MTTKYSQKGDVLSYTAGGAIVSGAVVELKHCVGIALSAAAASGDVIAVAVEGVYLVPKTTGTAWVTGEKVIWDTSAAKFDGSGATPATGDITGAAIAWGAAASADATAYVKLTPGNNTLT